MADREFRRACVRAVPEGRDPRRNGLMLLDPDTGRRLEDRTEPHAGRVQSNLMAVSAGREPGRDREVCPASPYLAGIPDIVSVFNGALEYLLVGVWLRRTT